MTDCSQCGTAGMAMLWSTTSQGSTRMDWVCDECYFKINAETFELAQ